MSSRQEIPLFDSIGRRVFWIFIQERDEKNPLTGFIRTKTNEDHPYRPAFRDMGMHLFTLEDEVHDWLVEQHFSYVLEYRWHENRLGWHIGLHDKASAALAKLTWGA